MELYTAANRLKFALPVERQDEAERLTAVLDKENAGQGPGYAMLGVVVRPSTVWALAGGMISLDVHGDFATANQVVERTKLFQLAVSLGAVESLIEQPAAMSHASYDAADRAAHGISDTLIRLSVGLEDFEDLRVDLDQALSAVSV